MTNIYFVVRVLKNLFRKIEFFLKELVVVGWIMMGYYPFPDFSYLHELTRIVGELFLENIYLIETLRITLDQFKKVKRKNIQLYLL